MMGWTVVMDARDFQRGKINLPTWGKVWRAQEFESFSERFEAALSVHEERKSAVAGLVDATYSKRLVLNPGAEMRTKKTNADGNGKKKKDKNGLARSLRTRRVATGVGLTSSWSTELAF